MEAMQFPFYHFNWQSKWVKSDYGVFTAHEMNITLQNVVFTRYEPWIIISEIFIRT